MDAAKAYRQAASMMPHTNAGLLAAICLREAGEMDQAISAIEHYIAEHPNDADGWANLGKLRIDSKQFSDAVPALEKALSLTSNSLARDMLNRALWNVSNQDRHDDLDIEISRLSKRTMVDMTDKALKILFVHQNFPGQFLHLAPELALRGHDCRALTDERNRRESSIPTWRYKHDGQAVDPGAARLGRNYIIHSDRGVTVARAALQLRENEGYVPDVIVGHSGWGETLFLKEVWPEAKLLVYAEFYYRGQGADVGFDPEFNPPHFDQVMISQGRAAYLGQALAHADRGLSPTEWQASTYPAPLRSMIDVVFDGVDTEKLAPDPGASIALPNGRILKAGDEVLTFVNRNLEPYRGYHILMRALPEVMAAQPEAQIVIVGGNEVSYGAAPKQGGTWKDIFLSEVRDRIDPSRVHFLGKVPYPSFVSLLHVSRVHAYLTYPFVLSWSAVEALAAGALVVGSRTRPVEEVIEHGKNGLLLDFFDVPGWSRQLIECLAEPERFMPLREEARRRAVASYDLNSVCLPRLVELVERTGSAT